MYDLDLARIRYGYQLGGKGKWISMTLKTSKTKAGKKVTRADKRKEVARETNRRGQESDEDEDGGEDGTGAAADNFTPPPAAVHTNNDPNNPNLTLPIPRYNAMLAVLRNTLYMCVSS